jgi:glycosyltransferase involved in cell wall biosynthesis
MLSGMGFGGGEKYFFYLAEHLSGPTYQFHFVTYREDLFYQEVRRRGFPATVIDMTRRFNPVSLWRLAKFFKKEGIDLVHTMGTRMNFYGRLAGRLAGVPYICSTVQNSLFDYPIGPVKRAIYVKADAWTARYAQRIIAVADALARDLREGYGIPQEKILTIHNGLDLSELKVSRSPEEARQELGIPQDSLCVGSAGRMTHQKGFIYLIRAMPEVFRRFPKARLLLVGDGPLREKLEAEALRLGIRELCIFPGYRADIPDILQAMDVFVLSSLSEGLPFVLLEALGMERPVVATAVSGNPELIEHGRNGLLVAPADPEALAQAVCWMLDNPEQAQALGRAGRSTVMEEFSVKKMVERTEAVYRSLWDKN